ncbi:AraC family transcriptional regulator [Paenibacillus sp. H1-7]|uniref:helix-turn-helix transcriptional regulator n=1 Tax=Paenibacillus sp. H1-7 TaxID=2282849 RepID=UPI001EF85E76|nr:AraC family transcriptional regulator [Paenibacillus sp. H1-7]ULL13581.1 AraC family transcriptional regulator [Paenibacillus sp. H1-7]
MEAPFTEWLPVVLQYTFWKRKADFQLAEDTYEEWVLFAVEEGSFRYEISESSGTAAFGDIIVCPPRTPFHREVVEPVSFHFYTFGWSRRDCGEDSAPIGGDEVPVRLALTDSTRLSSTYLYMRQLARLGPPAQRLGQWNHLLQDLWQQYVMERELAESASSVVQQELDPVMIEAGSWLQRHAFGPVLLKELCSNLGLSPVQFTRKFQAAYRMTPMDYLTSLRIQKAQTLLLETTLTLEQVAERCGYENGFYLSRVFSRRMNVSPSQFRSMHRV